MYGVYSQSPVRWGRVCFRRLVMTHDSAKPLSSNVPTRLLTEDAPVDGRLRQICYQLSDGEASLSSTDTAVNAPRGWRRRLPRPQPGRSLAAPRREIGGARAAPLLGGVKNRCAWEWEWEFPWEWDSRGNSHRNPSILSATNWNGNNNNNNNNNNKCL